MQTYPTADGTYGTCRGACERTCQTEGPTTLLVDRGVEAAADSSEAAGAVVGSWAAIPRAVATRAVAESAEAVLEAAAAALPTAASAEARMVMVAAMKCEPC